MPSQSRGYWSCDYCGMEGFDTYDDAKAHEIEDCPHRKRQPEAAARHEAAYPGPHPMVPYAQQQMMDAPQPETADYQDDPRYQIPQHPYYPRRIPLLIPGTQTDLSVTDSATCSSIEVMESTPEIVNAANVRRTERTMVSPGQVVLRCIQCVRNPASAQSTPQLFPNSISSMASTVRSLQDHLRVCAMVHDDVKRAIGPSVAKGRRALEDDERDRLALIDYCTNFCRREGLFNKHPPNSGIVLSEMETEAFWNPAYGHADQGMSPQFAPHYPTPQRPGPPSAAPMANDPMSTPMGSRRGRPAFQSDRSDAYPPPPQPSYPGGYPYSSSPYTPQYGGERAPYGDRERAYGTEAAQARYEQGPEYPPHPMEGAEGSQPPGYLQPYELPPDFPFVQEPGGGWECKYCSHIHPQYRDPQSIWSAPGGAPPPAAFIDQHLSMCRTYHTPAPPSGYSGPPSPYPFMPIHPQPSYPYGWDVPGQPPGPPAEPHEHHTPARAVMPPPPQPQTPYSQHPPPPATTPHSRELARRRSTGPPVSGLPPRPPVPMVGPEATAADREMERAKVFLTSSVKDFYGGPLVLEEDKLLLTDYFFYLMKQLKLCRFSELDRKTRGGKRDKIRIGYGGLQCVHCSDTPNGRKFYWSNVDRLANSFAEIPGHLFKCRRCPQPLKDALLKLKGRHAEQMARLPRGSQKVFFRRMWRRLHDEDPAPIEGEEVTPAKSESDLFSPSTQGTKRSAEDEGVGWSDDAFDDTPKRGSDYYPRATPSSAISTRTPSLQRKPPAVATTSASVGMAISAANADTEISPATSGSESVVIVERTSQEAAKALASSDLEHPAPPSPSSRVLLAIPEDKEWLSDMDCFMRRQVEVFCASSEDVLAARSDRKHRVALGQIGIRCLHCALSKPRFGARGTAVAFPYAISGIFECVRELGRTHMESCENMPKSVKDRLISFQGSSSLTSVLRKYYLLAAKALGLYDTTEGIRAGAESIPLGSQAAFAFSPETSDLSEQLRLERGAADPQALESSESKPSATVGTPSRKRQSSSPGAQSPREKKEDEAEPASPKQTGEPV